MMFLCSVYILETPTRENKVVYNNGLCCFEQGPSEDLQRCCCRAVQTRYSQFAFLGDLRQHAWRKSRDSLDDFYKLSLIAVIS